MNKADHVFASMNTFFTKVFVGCGSCMGGDDSDSTTELGEHEGIIVIMEFRSTISVANNRN